MEVIFGKQKILDCCSTNTQDIFDFVSKKLGLHTKEFYLVSNGRRVSHENTISGKIHVVLKLPGGKGGFGSMLRAIGAQIEKTTNREACRDLSGRRLRDINEEQRLKKWVAEQADREKEAKERKKKKLEKLLEQPKHTFVDKDYDNERSSLPEKVEDAVLKGLEASCSSKRKSDDTKSKIVKKKPKLWIDSELEEDISSSDCDSENEDKESKFSAVQESSNSSENVSGETQSTSNVIEESNMNSIDTANIDKSPNKSEDSEINTISSNLIEENSTNSVEDKTNNDDTLIKNEIAELNK